MASSDARATVYADSGNRAAALILDFLLLILVAPTDSAPAALRQILFPALALLYFAGLPLTPLQGTLGKWLFRIKLSDRQGQPLTWRASTIRAATELGWFGLPVLLGAMAPTGTPLGSTLTQAWCLLFLLPWASIGFLPRRQSLFDLLAGAVVVRARANRERIADAEPAQRPSILQAAGLVAFCLSIGLLASTALEMQMVRSMFARVAYAIEESRPLRNRIETFYGDEQRWPTADDLGVPEWTPYPDGGGYRLEANGVVTIGFTVRPELKGHQITFTPQPATGDRLEWRCAADAGFDQRYLPASCR